MAAQVLAAGVATGGLGTSTFPKTWRNSGGVGRTMLAAELVEFGEHDGRGQAVAVERDGIALLKLDLDVLGRVRRGRRVDAARPHAVLRLLPRVLQRVALVRDVQQVSVHRVRRLACSRA